MSKRWEVSADPQVLVGLGSNQGESTAILKAALVGLQACAASDLCCSRLWRTSPVDCPPGSPDFLNAAVAFDALPGITPEAMLRRLKLLEREQGRMQHYQRNAPRPLDLDLLLFGDEQRSLPWFTLPHPRAIDRQFVLRPAAEVAPNRVWPGTTSTIAELLAALHTDEQLELVCDRSWE